MDDRPAEFSSCPSDERAHEILAVEYLTGDLTSLGSAEFSDHQPASVRLPLREIAATALILDAGAIVVAHYHPSGDHRPSAADIAATRRLAQLCFYLEIELHDHVIMAGRKRFSFREEGLL